MMRLWFSAMTSLALLTSASASFANGRFPATGQVALSPTDPNLIISRSTYGFLVSKDKGTSWDWVCELAVGFSGPEDPMLAILQSNNVVATLANGLSVTKDVGCQWDFAGPPVTRDLFIDIAARKSDARVAYAISSKYAGGMSDAGALLFRSELFMTTDGATTWTKVGTPFDPTLLLETIDVTESNPHRLYVSAIRGSGAELLGFLLVSDDGGQTWVSRNVPLVINEDRAPFIGAVSPTNADVLYVRTSATPGKPNRLLVSTDAGKTWAQKHQTTGAMLGFALSPDGSKVYLGSQEDGLWSATASDLAFTRKSDIQVQCLTVSADGIWACSNEVTGFVVGYSKNDGATFEPKLRLSGLRGPLECPAGTGTHDTCLGDWPRQRAELGIGTIDAGALGDGSANLSDAGATPAPSEKSKCGCSVREGSGGSSLAGIAGLSALVATSLRALRLRSRRSRESR